MTDHLDEIVRRAVAQQLGIRVSAIQMHDRFEADLGLQPLDLVLIGLLVEDAEQIDLPFERLDATKTVGDLATLVRRVIAGERHWNEPVFVRVRCRRRNERPGFVCPRHGRFNAA